MSDDNDDDKQYTVPLQDRRVFGAGISREKIKFVRAGGDSPDDPQRVTQSKSSAAERYLSIVMKQQQKQHQQQRPDQILADGPASAPPAAQSSPRDNKPSETVCSVCKLPVNDDNDDFPEGAESGSYYYGGATARAPPHAASLVHQVCLSHSHPPSHLDRGRQGLKYLSSYGWDPDGRRGLGSDGQGIREPVKAVAKNDTLGIGVDVDLEGFRRKQRAAAAAANGAKDLKSVKKLNAGGARRLHAEQRRKTERLREIFYANEDLQKYLG